MQKPVRWGILGAANFALHHMGRAIHAAEGAELAALATSSPAKAAPFQAFAPGLRLHDSYDALLADPEIDAVYIPLPNHLHVEWSLKALDAGKHVLCEKPIALEAGQIAPLIEKRDATGLVAAEAYMIVHHPQWQRVRQMLQDGAVGTLRHVGAFFSYMNPDMENIRNRPETGGGGIPDIGVYTYGAARWATGQEPEEITYARVDWHNGVDTTAHVAARFPGFDYAATTSTRLAPRQEVTFHGDEAVLRVETPFNANVFGEARLVLSGPGMETRVERFPGVNHYVLQVQNFCRAVREGAAYPWTLEDARGTQAMIDAVFAKAGRPGAA